MIYSDLPAGATLFVDASPFIHHFQPNPAYGPASTEFLERIENYEINGVTTTHVISEVAHRLMTIEAMQAFGWKSAGRAWVRLEETQKKRNGIGPVPFNRRAPG